jgi:hypothetical protein
MSEMSQMFAPALIQLVSECEEDESTWAETFDDEDGTGNTVYAAGISAIERLSLDLKDKFTLTTFDPLIQAKINSNDWKDQQAGYMTFGLITEACKDLVKTKLQDIMT